MVRHHPSTDFLTEHAAGVLPVAQSACVAAHLSYCQRCRHLTERLEDVGGSHFEQLDPAPVGDSVLDRVLARLEDPEPLRYARNEASDTQLPGLLDRLINGDYADLVWKRVTQSLSISYLKTGDPQHEFALYRIAAGGRIPEHTHGGSEMTLVLQGGFADESGEYHPGDFLVREGWDKHTPVALEGEECICLAVLDAPLRFTRLRHRWLNPLLKVRAG
jgi:putative transcriptional regulator